MAQAPAAEWRPSHNPWLVTISVLLATFMEVLDTSIANVALPHIAGNLSATIDESSWVLTSYLVSNAIILVAAGWMSSIFGRKRYLAFSVILFTLASALCGMAQTLPQLVVARILQGLGGGGLQPLAQAVLLESFPAEERGKAMAAYGMGIVVAPIIGPTLGGWITDAYSWRWLFYINIPIGMLGLFMQQMFLEEPPYLKRVAGSRIDYVGFGFMALGVGLLQIVLDKGQELDWFSSLWLRWGALGSVVFLALFVAWELRQKHPVANLRLLTNRNFGLGTAFIAVLGAVLYGTTALLPMLMQSLMGYPALQCGLAMTPRGLGSFVSMFVVGRLTKKVDNRILLMFGFSGLAATMWVLSGLNLDVAPRNISWPLVLNGFSMGFVFVPLTTLTMATLRQDEIYQATSIYALLRNIGGSVGIASLVAMNLRRAQVHQVALVSNLTQTSPMFQDRLAGLSATLGNLGVPASLQAAYAMVYGTVLRQALLLSFMDVFRFLVFICLVCVPLAFVFERGRRQASGPDELREKGAPIAPPRVV
ncbi:MAG: DHA2 family efflux MFS transporter permease subunit [Elusimicrobia bacterium]|nr:DHA2 family efflux MFS transporter permease subunit [Elusimicrobiota bacterium]